MFGASARCSRLEILLWRAAGIASAKEHGHGALDGDKMASTRESHSAGGLCLRAALLRRRGVLSSWTPVPASGDGALRPDLELGGESSGSESRAAVRRARRAEEERSREIK